MSRPRNQLLVALGIFILAGAAPLVMAAGAAPDKRKAPEPPALDLDATTTLCVGCEKPYFEPPGHNEANDRLAGNLYNQELRKALYWQDTVHQFESRAHFDNCAFDESIRYVDLLVAEVDALARQAGEAKKSGDEGALADHLRNAFFALGQALHAIQDFYAHTNFVELMAARHKTLQSVPLVRVWTSSGRAFIADLRKSGLISGVVWWGFPKRCPDGASSHADLAKDSATTKAGGIRLEHWENLSQYAAAVELAKATSYDFMMQAFKRWPILGEATGRRVLFEVVPERRDFNRKPDK